MQWFPEGGLNAAYNAVDRSVHHPLIHSHHLLHTSALTLLASSSSHDSDHSLPDGPSLNPTRSVSPSTISPACVELARQLTLRLFALCLTCPWHTFSLLRLRSTIGRDPVRGR